VPGGVGGAFGQCVAIRTLVKRSVRNLVPEKFRLAGTVTVSPLWARSMTGPRQETSLPAKAA
jgi:hypothetical protein